MQSNAVVLYFHWDFLDMASRLLSIVSFIKHPAKTIDAVRARAQQYEM
jgi:hypothetical protein